MPSPIRDLIRDEIRTLLEQRRVVVWYDPSRELWTVFDDFKHLALAKVDACTSMLEARQQADAHWAVLTNPNAGLRYCTTLLIYVPWARATKEEDMQREPFEAYARIGATFGDKQAHSLDSLARQAIPSRKAEIDRLFSERRKVMLEQLEALAEQAGYPLLKQAIGTEDAIDVGAQLIAAPERLQRARAAAGVENDLLRLLRDAFGFDGSSSIAALAGEFARWVLFSEFAFDVSGQVPSNVRTVPHADPRHRTAIYKLCDRLRGTEEWREAYVQAASKVEDELGLGSIADEVSPWGERVTFAAEDVAALRFVQAECVAGRLDAARRTLDPRKRSLWLHQPARNQRWQLATRCLELLEAERRWRDRAMTTARSVEEHMLAYTSLEDGLWRVDRCYRWMERAESSCTDKSTLERLLTHTRAVYRGTIDGTQGVFLAVVARDGWPAGPLKQTQVFARHVAPSVQEGVRVAYFLIDALRFELVVQDAGGVGVVLGSKRFKNASLG